MTYVALSSRLWATGARSTLNLTTQRGQNLPMQFIKFNIRNQHNSYESRSYHAYSLLKYFNSTQLNRMKDCFIENLTLFARNFHKQSNVYFCLRLRRFTQVFNFYHRIYSPKDVRLIFHRTLNNINSTKLFLMNLLRSRFLLSFVSVSLFSWEDNRITDKEIKDLIEDFLVFEKLNETSDEEDNQGDDDKNDSSNGPNQRIENGCNKNNSNDSAEKSSSYMIVNCLDSEDDDSDNWELIINRPHFHVWRKSVNKSSLYEYKVFGTFYDVSPYSFFAVQRDLEYRKSWDNLVIHLDIINREPESIYEKIGRFIDDSRNEIVRWIMKFPYPMKSREYLFMRRSRIDYERNFIVVLSRAVEYPDLPECNKHVRVYDYFSQMVIRPHNNSFYDAGFDYMLTYFDDPRASFPSPAYNWMASRGVPDFVEKMHQASIELSKLKEDDWAQAKEEEQNIRLSIHKQRVRPPFRRFDSQQTKL